MNKSSKTKQQLLLEIKELRTRIDVAEQRFREANERMQAEMTERKRVGEDFARAQKYAESIVETIREPLLVLTADLKVISANQSFYQTFNVTPEETEGRFIYSVGNRQWDIPALRKLLEEIVPQNSHFNGFEVDHEFPSIGRKMMLLNARRIHRQGKGTEMILLTIEDVTERNQAREVLEISETRYRRLFETAQDGILIVDADTEQISDVNPFLIQMLGYSHEDFLGRKLWEIGAFKDIEASRTAFSELQTRGYVRYEDLPLQTRGYVRYEDLPLQTRDGRSMAVECVSNVYLVDHHKVIQCNIRDITGRKQIEDAQQFLVQCGLPASGEDFFKSLARYLAENLGMDYVRIDRLQEDGLAAQTVAICFDGEFQDNLTYALKDTPSGDVLEKTICCFPKGVRHLYPQDVVLQEMMAESYVGSTLWSSKGQPIGLIAIIGRQPLANPQLAESMLKLVAVRAAGELERREAEEALQEKTHELDGRVKELNCLYAFSKLIERPDIALSEIFEELVDIIPPGWQYPEVTCARLVFEDQILKTPNFNETIWKQSSPILVDGRSAGTLEVYYLEEKPECDEGPFLKEERDLIDALAARLGKTTQRKRMEEVLLKSEETLLAFFDAGIHQRSILELREDDIVYKLTNQNTAAFFGLTVEEMTGKSLKGLGVREEGIRFWLEQFRQCQKTGETTSFEYVFPYKGRKPWFRCSFTPLRLPNEQTPLFRFMALEITDRKHAELLSKALNDINIQINSGLEYDEMMQSVVTEAGRAMGCETAAISLKKDDRWILSYVYGLPKEWVGTEVGDEEEPLALLALKTKKPVVIEDVYNDERVNRKHVDKYEVRSFLVSPILAGDKPVGVIFFNYQNPTTFSAIQVDFCLKLASSISFAIQNAKLVKEVTYHAKELENANKELESFAYSVSHDLKAPLIVASGFSRRLSEVYGEKLDDKGRHYLQRLQEACQQMNLLIEDLLKLSKMTASRIKFESIDVSDLVKSIATQLKEAQPEREIKFLIEEGLTAKGDSHFLKIGLENLLGNAWKFTGKRKRAKIEFGLAKRLGGEPTYFVRDNGCGFDMSMADKLFKPFQRLHEDGEFSGTGVGLATVHRIITRHGGRIWAESVVGKGTTFFFTLPS